MTVDIGIVGSAIGLFAVTNIDDLLILALFFARGAGQRGTTRAIAVGQYLGFLGILVAAVAAASGASLLPESVLPYLGLLPLFLGLRSAVQTWRDRHEPDDAQTDGGTVPSSLELAAVTFANGGDNIGVYVPVFANAGLSGTTVYVAVFLVLVAVWVAAGCFFATRPSVAAALSRWGHILLPVVLIAVGVLILVEGGAFGV
ncbi:cadmium resistance transporter [Kineosporia rhizophila]|nr:cadmium resistance transporter [Kineosporia rhizophila]MCE0536377.1 cadmium resistance transporter [Kineosporia rhizophila]